MKVKVLLLSRLLGALLFFTPAMESAGQSAIPNGEKESAEAKAAQAKIELLEAKLSKLQQQLREVEQRWEQFAGSPEREFWLIAQHPGSPRVHAELLTDFLRLFPDSSLAKAAEEEISRIGRTISHDLDDLMRGHRVAEARILVTGLTASAPRLAKIESDSLAEIEKHEERLRDAAKLRQQIAERRAAGEDAIEQLRDGMADLKQVASRLRGMNPSQVRQLLGEPDEIIILASGSEYVYDEGVSDPSTGLPSKLRVTFAGANPGQVLSTTGPDRSVIVDPQLQRSLNTNRNFH